ncbi:DUF3016 domain-containing protein [Thalassotalea maritima]|uniref:DUF3016 domain-containing protein n=1 Tax=Thalassotalea maritima TaxID=3242416 RepID=UPI0035271CAF
MRLVKNIAFALAGSVAVAATSYAGQAEVNWVDPQSYTDIRSGDESRKRFEERVFKELEQHISELAAKLPAEQTLKMDVVNLDLAGEIRYMVGPNNDSIRVIEDLYFPKMRFNYSLLDKDGKVLAQGKENIKDMGFFNSTHQRLNRESFTYEKAMISDWFEETFDVK